MKSASASAAAISAALVTMVFWGGTAVANRYAIAYLDPIVVAALRSMLAGALALVVALALRLQFPKEPHDRLLLLISGITSFALWPIFISVGLARTTASHAALIMATLPIVTVLLASFLNRNAPPRGWWLGAIAAFLGAAWLILDQGTSLAVDDPRSAAIGDLIILVGCFVCASGYVAGGKLSPKIGAFATTFWGLATALIVTVPLFALNQQGSDWAGMTTSAWSAIAWMTLCSSFFGYLLWFYALGRGGIERIGSLQLLMPIFTLLGAVLILDEVLTPRLVALSALVLAGTVIAHRNSSRDK